VVSESVGQAQGITTWEELRDKCQDCAEHVLPAELVRRFMDQIEIFENVETLVLFLPCLSK